MELPDHVIAEIDLPEPWRDNLLAVAVAPLACLPAKLLPHPARRTIEAMRGVRLLAGWDRRGEGLGLYVTLTPWSAECLRAALERIPPRGRKRREIAERVQELDLKISLEEPLRWEYDRRESRRDGLTGNLTALRQAGYLPPTMTIVDEEETVREEAEPGRCETPKCRREVKPGVRHCLKCREAALRRLVKQHDQEREEEREARKAAGRVRTSA